MKPSPTLLEQWLATINRQLAEAQRAAVTAGLPAGETDRIEEALKAVRRIASAVWLLEEEHQELVRGGIEAGFLWRDVFAVGGRQRLRKLRQPRKSVRDGLNKNHPGWKSQNTTVIVKWLKELGFTVTRRRIEQLKKEKQG